MNMSQVVFPTSGGTVFDICAWVFRGVALLELFPPLPAGTTTVDDFPHVGNKMREFPDVVVLGCEMPQVARTVSNPFHIRSTTVLW